MRIVTGLFAFLAFASTPAGFSPAVNRPAAGGALTLRVLGVTAMQAVLMYTASDDRPCTLRVSESPMLSPLVPDVDPALFPGSNLDSRSGNLSNGRDRIFVVGTRGWAHKAANGRRVSRALQLLTKHYARVDCGPDHADSEFSTTNQPLGMTWVEPFPVDPNAPGEDAYPTVDWNDASQRIIDPQSGMAIWRLSGYASWNSGPGKPRTSPFQFVEPGTGKKFWLRSQFWDIYAINVDDPADKRFLFTAYLEAIRGKTDAGFCSLDTFSIIPGADGPEMYCGMPTSDTMTHLLRVRLYLGNVFTGKAAPRKESIDARLSDCNSAKSNQPCWIVDDLTPTGLDTLIEAFSRSGPGPVYSASRWRAGVIAMQADLATGKTAITLMARRYQDSYGWAAVWGVQERAVIAAAPTYDKECAWCKIHFLAPVENTDHWMVISTTPGHYARPWAPEAEAYSGDWEAEITKGCQQCSSGDIPDVSDPRANDGCPADRSLIPPGNKVCTEITLAEEPKIQAPNPDSKGEVRLPGKVVSAGDFFTVNYGCQDGQEFFRVLSRQGLTFLTARGWPNRANVPGAHGKACSGPVNGPVALMQCSAIMSANRAWEMGQELLTPIWDFRRYPHGEQMITLSRTTGHGSQNKNGQLGGGYDTNCPLTECIGRYDGFDVRPPTGDFVQTTSWAPSINGKFGESLNGQFEGYPTIAPDGKSMWETRRDARFSTYRSPLATLVSGTLYKIARAKDIYEALNNPLIRHPKSIPFAAYSGARGLIEMSGPNSVISDGPADAFKFCYAYRDGECRPGSQVGELYMNAPGNIGLDFESSTIARPGLHYSEWMPSQLGVNQMTFDGPTCGDGSCFRSFGHAFMFMHSPPWNNVDPGPDGTHLIFPAYAVNGKTDQNALFIAKTPPVPPKDGIDRTRFLPVPVAVTSPPEGTDNVIVEFGYREYGAPTDHFCSQRREICVANNDRLIGTGPDWQTPSRPYTPSGDVGTEVVVNQPGHRLGKDSSVRGCCTFSGNTTSNGNWRVGVIDEDNFRLVGSSSNGQSGQTNGELRHYPVRFDSPFFYATSDAFSVVRSYPGATAELGTDYMHKLSAGAIVKLADGGTYRVRAITGHAAFTLEDLSGQDVPFVPEMLGTGNFAGLPCSAGCTVTAPAIAQRILYYRVVYRDQADQVVGVSEERIAVTP